MLLCFENPFFWGPEKSRAKIADVLPHFYWIFNVFYWFFNVLCFDNKAVAMRQKGRWAPWFFNVLCFDNQVFAMRQKLGFSVFYVSTIRFLRCAKNLVFLCFMLRQSGFCDAPKTWFFCVLCFDNKVFAMRQKLGFLCFMLRQ